MMRLRLVLGLAACAAAANPGLMLGITNSALDYARKVALPILIKDLQGVTIPSLSGDVHTPIGHVDYDISDIKVSSVSIDSSSLTFTTTGLKLSLDQATLKATAHWHYREKSFPHVSDSGSVDISVSHFDVTADIDCVADHGAPQLSMSHCDFNVGSVDVDFHGGASWLYNIFKDPIEKTVKDALGKQLCPLVEQELGPANAALRKLPMNVTLPDGVVASYALTENPIITSSYLVTAHSGTFVPPKPASTPCPFSPQEIDRTGSLPRMLYIWVTAYEPETAGWAYQQGGALDFIVTPAQIPPSSPVQLNTSSFADIIPAMARLYPNMNMTIGLVARPAPIGVTVTRQALNATLYLDLLFNVTQPNGTGIPVFTLNATGSAAGKVTANSSKAGQATIYFSLDLLNVAVSVEKSQIGPFSPLALETLVQLVIQGVVLPKINTAGAKGAAIPMVDGVRLVKPQIVFGDGYVRVDSDVTYEPSVALP